MNLLYRTCKHRRNIVVYSPVAFCTHTLACVIMNLVWVSDPDTVVFGGGIMSDVRFQERVRARLEPDTMRGVTHGLVPSSFSPHIAGLLGAASLGMK